MLLPVNIHFYKQSPVCGLRTLKKLCSHRKLCAGRTTCNNVRTDEQLCICSQQYSEILQLFSCWMFLQTRVWLLRSHRTVSAWKGIKSAEMSWKGRIQLWVYHYNEIWKLQIHTAALNTLRFDKGRWRRKAHLHSSCTATECFDVVAALCVWSNYAACCGKAERADGL